MATTDKETVICVQNSLRELRFDEIKVKYFHLTKNQITKNMKEKMDKNSYQKDVKYLGYYPKNIKIQIILIPLSFLGEKEVTVLNPVLIMEKNIPIKKIDIINIKEIDLIQIMIGNL